MRITFYYLRSVVRPPVVVLAFLFESSAGPILRTCSVCPLSSSAPPGSLGCWPTKHLPAAPAARQAGGALVILTVLYAGAPSHCSSHKLWQLQLETKGARPARPEWAQWSAPIRIKGSLAFARSREILRVLRPRFHRRGHLVHRYYQKVSCLRYCD